MLPHGLVIGVFCLALSRQRKQDSKTLISVSLKNSEISEASLQAAVFSPTLTLTETASVRLPLILIRFMYIISVAKQYIEGHLMADCRGRDSLFSGRHWYI
ncbi:hypothetical protein HHK36_002946 [Tetracentron sinense]|uniref:Uncharacterized protein n=1 Tax=Tetracentron sinense TaxID=13715 RepID=A0A835DS16_TETSI|nr:hypothetical protein HHK36_002946 [Tetracentron sinense]